MSLSSIYGPGYAGYMQGVDSVRQKDQQNLQTTMGLMSLLRQKEADAREAQLHPLRLEQITANLGELRRKEDSARRVSEAISQIQDPNERAAAMANPAEWAKRKMAGNTSKVLPPGAALVSEDGTPIFTNPRLNQPTTIERMLDAAGITDPARRSAIINRAIEKQTSHAPGTTVNVGEKRYPIAGGISVNGKNMPAFRDDRGNVFDQFGKVVPQYDLPISSADQTAEQKRVAEAATLKNLRGMVNVIDTLATSNPGTISGVGGAATNFLGTLYNQLLGNVRDASIVTPNQKALQLRDSILVGLNSLSRLSDGERRRIENIWGLDVFGSPAKVREAAKLTSGIINSRYAGSEVSVGRPTPGGGDVPIDDLVSKYLNRGR